ncbi:hypothetical protein RC74_03270 [Falsihalocynthiibacter arcticus]|uniref:DUF3768 domain-containing protein n=2 Tax=Falsihalocynthiibacter arcticus TaxID=1579316 RepID=A0A126V5G4_9RHOB|nr:hypothetical protein RC74_03270 [Falsihalocynthiibacter arcticus]
MTHVQRTSLIREQNDQFRKDFKGGHLLLSIGVAEMAKGAEASLLHTLAEFNDFSEGNDPYGEHDFGCLTWGGEAIFWKIDYYDLDMRNGSPDPADLDVTARALTIMLPCEY